MKTRLHQLYIRWASTRFLLGHVPHPAGAAETQRAAAGPLCAMGSKVNCRTTYLSSHTWNGETQLKPSPVELAGRHRRPRAVAYGTAVYPRVNSEPKAAHVQGIRSARAGRSGSDRG
eukprot:5044253-Prymnesium_polylepis.1